MIYSFDSKKDKVLLKVREPLIKTYTEVGNFFSIIPDKKESWAWIFSDFIHIVSDNWRDYVYMHNYWFWLRNSTHMTFSRIDPTILKLSFNDSIIDLLIAALNEGYYCTLYTNRHYLTNHPYYGKGDNNHPTLVYGYDLENQYFYISDSINYDSYERSTYTFTDVEKAYKGLVFENFKELYNIFLYKQYEAGWYNFNVNYLIKQLELFLSPESLNLGSSIKAYNLDIVKTIKPKYVNKSLGVNISPFSVFHDHMVLMTKRIDYLFENRYIVNKSLLEKCAEITKEYFYIKMNVLKLPHLSASSIYSKEADICKRLQSVAESEQEFIEMLIMDLKKTNK